MVDGGEGLIDWASGGDGGQSSMGGNSPPTGLSPGLLEGDQSPFFLPLFPISTRIPDVGRAGDLMLIEGGKKNALSDDRLPPLPESSLPLPNTIGEMGGRLAPSLEVEVLGGGVDVQVRRISLATVDWLRALLCIG
jgi:hypothetical protein